MVYGYTENGNSEQIDELISSVARINEVIKNITYEIQRVTFNIYVSESVEVTGLEYLNKNLKTAMLTRALLQQQVNNYKKQ